jgi:hypothetical protein
MSKKTKKILTPAEIKKLAKKIVSENPIYMPDEPTIVGSPENLIEDQEEAENEQSNTKKSERSKE